MRDHGEGQKAVICITRGKKGIISYNSGLIYFKHNKSVQVFTDEVKRRVPGIEVIPVSINRAFEPTEGSPGGYWCPYCQSWEYWPTGPYKGRNCPICGISDRDFSVREYNNLWNTNMKSKSQKVRMERVIKKQRKKGEAYK